MGDRAEAGRVMQARGNGTRFMLFYQVGDSFCHLKWALTGAGALHGIFFCALLTTRLNRSPEGAPLRNFAAVLLPWRVEAEIASHSFPRCNLAAAAIPAHVGVIERTNQPASLPRARAVRQRSISTMATSARVGGREAAEGPQPGKSLVRHLLARGDPQP